MEEFVGKLWHRFITHVTDTRYPEAAVTIDEMSKTAGILFRAFGGDPALNVRASAITGHGARRSFLQWLSGGHKTAELSWLDSETLRIPSVIDIYPVRELNRDLYIWLIALAAFDDGKCAHWFAKNQKLTLDILECYPGFRSRYARLVEAEIAIRPDPSRLPENEKALEESIRQALREPGSVTHPPLSRRMPYPVRLWLHPNPPQGFDGRRKPGKGKKHEEGGGSDANQDDKRKRVAETVDMPDGDGMIVPFGAEKILSWVEYIRVNRPTDEDEDQDAIKVADDLDFLSVARDENAKSAKLRFDLDLPPASADDEQIGAGIKLPEWDYRKEKLIADYCLLRPMIASSAKPCGLPEKLRKTARRLRGQFEAMATTRVWRKSQPEGVEIDVDAFVRFSTDRACGHPVEERGLYRTLEKKERDLACLLLADLSLSTDAWVGNHGRVVDVIKDSLFLFSEALAATGDRFGLYGFSSLKRGNVRFHILKDFSEKYNDRVRGRIAVVKPGYYTRMGAAIRHGAAILSEQPSVRRLLLILTDGKPNDLDRYEGKYGVEDTRMALHEARLKGLQPFCVTIDREAEEYLPHIFGAGGFVVIRNPADLPKKLPLLYAQMTK